MKTYAPGLHIAFSLAWFFSLREAILTTSATSTVFPIDFISIGGMLTFFLALFFLRAADEIKDYEYDKIYNPERPLVTGDVTPGDLNWYMAGTFFIVILLNLVISARLALIAGLDLAYGRLLINIEKKFPVPANGLFKNLLITFPVNILLSVYVLFMLTYCYNVPVDWKGVSWIVVFSSAFLHFEFTRKTGWPRLAKKDERLYSHVIGGVGSGLLCLFFALFSSLFAIYLFEPFRQNGICFITSLSPLLALIPAIINVGKYFSNRTTRYNMKPKGMIFLTIFYVSVLVHGLTVSLH